MKKEVILTVLLVLIILSNYSTAAPSCTTFPSPQWERATPSEMGLNESKLIELKNLVGGNGAVYYKGKKVYYWGDPTQKNDLSSASKVILSGILFNSIGQGKITSVDQKVSDFMGSCANGITFYHLANMMSGYNLGEAPGTKWAYNDYGINLYSHTLFDKVWRSSPQNVFNIVFQELQFQNSPTLSSGSNYGRVTMSPDDFARIGLLITCKGNWKGNQIIPQEYIGYIKNQIPGGFPASTSSCKNDPCKTGSFGGSCNDGSTNDGRDT